MSIQKKKLKNASKKQRHTNKVGHTPKKKSGIAIDYVLFGGGQSLPEETHGEIAKPLLTSLFLPEFRLGFWANGRWGWGGGSQIHGADGRTPHTDDGGR